MNDLELMDEMQKNHSFQGQMNGMAKSIEIVIDKILEQNDVKPRGSFGNRIKQFKEVCPEFPELLGDLMNFNEFWNITKHGVIIMGADISESFFKDEETHKFNQQRKEEISKNFTEVMKKLIVISKKKVIEESLK
ncbi:hypothetical protein HYV49_04360 [Candidatus Pacearchaeota archaeon]|nr:hypothetical protein [Candidatus Pacearchaeota archaeon]